MTEGSPAYRARAAFVRGAARDHLRQLRDDRLAAREAVRALESVAEPVLPEVAVLAEPEAAAPAEAPVTRTAARTDQGGGVPVPEASAAEVRAASSPPLNPKVPLSPGMRRMLQARASLAEPTEVAAAPEPELPAAAAETPVADVVVADVAVAGCDLEAGSPSPAPVEPELEEPEPVEPAPVEPEPEESGAMGEGADVLSSAQEPLQAPGGEDAEDAVLPEGVVDEIPEPEPEPEPVPEADEPVEPVPEISAAAPVSADDTATPPPGALPDLCPSEAAAGERTSDLVRLPGAGPGLIWMLNECEIHTLADLAAADCTDLTARMGLAGRILDLGGWIAFARAAEVR